MTANPLNVSRHGPGQAPRAGDLTEGRTISVYGHPREFPSDLVDFFVQAEVVSMQFGADWYGNLVDAVYAGDAGVRFYVLERDGKPTAALPLICRRQRLGWHAQALSNYYTALYAPLLRSGIDGPELATLIKVVVRAHPGLASFQFAPMALGDASFAILHSALKHAGLRCFSYFCFGNWYMPVQQAWAPYLQSRQSRQRNTISRMGKKFSAEGGRLEIIQGGEDDIARGLQAYADVYAASWKQPEPYPDFMPGLIRLCAARGWLRLGVAWLGDKAVAAQIWIVANGKADIYKLAYDEAYKNYSPGTLLTAVLMQTAMDVDHATEIDYLIGDDPYKESWMSSRRERWGLIAFNPFSLGGLYGLARESGARAVSALLTGLRRGDRAPAKGQS